MKKKAKAKAKTKVKVKAKAKTKAKGKAKTSRKKSAVKDLAPRKASAVKGGLLPATPQVRSGISNVNTTSNLGMPAVQAVQKEKW
jgi:hypothetical protein